MYHMSTKLHSALRLTALLCAMLLCVGAWAPAVAAGPLAQGTDGAITWSLTAGTLIINGDGAIPDYTEQKPAPWHEHRDSILTLQLGSGITAVGTMAFYECAALRTVYLPDAVQTVGNMAFSGCERLSSVHLGRVTAVGDYAFSRCFALADAMLPATLTTIGAYAFYRCESLSYLRIPAAVTSIGSSAFAYCDGLVWVDIVAPLTALPEWCFYGCRRLTMLSVPATLTEVGDSAFTRCDALTTVYHDGDDAARDALSGSIAESLPGFTVSQMSSANDLPPTVTDKETTSNDTARQEITTQVTHQQDVTIRVEQTVTTPVTDGIPADKPETMDTVIYGTIENEAGWDTVMDAIYQQIDETTSFEIDYGDGSTVQAEITLRQDMPLSGEWLNSLAGRDVVVSIITPNGSRWSINGAHIKGYEFEKSYELSYTLTPCEDVPDTIRNVIGTAPSWWLEFHSAFAFPVTVDLFLDSYATYQHATLYENLRDGTLTKLQTSRIDGDGLASFRLAVINATTRYLVSMNIAGTSYNDVMVSDDDVVDFRPLEEQYEFSEPRGFMGMTMQEFTHFLLTIGAVFAVVVVALILFFVIRGKRKAKLAAIRAKVMGTDALDEYDAPKKAKSTAKPKKKPTKKDQE